MVNFFHSFLPPTKQSLNGLPSPYLNCFSALSSSASIRKAYAPARPTTKVYPRKSLFIFSLMFCYLPGITFFFMFNCWLYFKVHYLLEVSVEFPTQDKFILFCSLRTLHNYHILLSLQLHIRLLISLSRAGLVLLSPLFLGIKLAQEGTPMFAELCIFVYAYLFRLLSFEMFIKEGQISTVYNNGKFTNNYTRSIIEWPGYLLVYSSHFATYWL